MIYKELHLNDATNYMHQYLNLGSMFILHNIYT